MMERMQLLDGITDVHGNAVGEIDTFRPSAPLKPITGGALADLDEPYLPAPAGVTVGPDLLPGSP